VNVAVPAELLIAFLLTVVRISAWIMVAPPFNSRAVPPMVKVALAVALALPVAPRMVDRAPEPEIGPLVAAILLQVLAGLVLGFIAMILFAAVQAAGELIDLFSGFTVASLYDPLSNSTSSMFGRLHQLIAVTLLFATGAHLLLVRGLMASFDVVPLRADAGALPKLMISQLGRFFIAALEIAAPLVVVLFLAELAIGLVGRAAPSLNVLSTSFPLKILLSLSLAGLTLTVLPGALERLVQNILRASAAASRMLA
jgi:flagellar biosynthetic protein FliR